MISPDPPLTTSCFKDGEYPVALRLLPPVEPGMYLISPANNLVGLALLAHSVRIALEAAGIDKPNPAMAGEFNDGIVVFSVPEHHLGTALQVLRKQTELRIARPAVQIGYWDPREGIARCVYPSADAPGFQTVFEVATAERYQRELHARAGAAANMSQRQ